MSWQFGALAILALALIAGFAWYERSRPDARIVALVATLAALAALGRIAFAAVPNVKPTTDIVLIAGYALGPAPGFVVGAAAGLVSNFFFGQGPWTVWQMAAWGVTGVLGAGLAMISRRRIARWPLALACFAAGFAFTAVQDIGDWVNYSDHSLAQLGVYVGKGTGFDLIHAVGCLVFALAFGPWLIRSLMRFRRRLEVHWRPLAEGATVPLALGLIALTGFASLVSSTPARATSSSTSYLLGAENVDGGFGPAPGSSSSALYAGWAALGLAAEGINAQDVHHGGAGLLAYIAAGVPSNSDPGSLERTILVVRAAGVPATAFAGRNLVAALEGDLRRDGSVSDQVNWTAFAILALRAAGAPVPGRTVAWLLHQQDADGGFGFGTAGGGSDVDDTGAVLQALAGTGSGREVTRAVGYLRASQNGDGGFPSQPGQGSDAQSTAWAVQGLLAVGLSPSAFHRGGMPSPVAYLDGLTAPDGHVRYSRGNDQTPVWVTAEVLMALAGHPLPLAPVPRASAATPAGGSSGSTPHRAATAHPNRGTRGARTRRRHGSGHAQSLAPSALALAPLAAAEEPAIMGALTRVLAPIGVRPQGFTGP